jgi:hypothetical protein
VNVCTSLCMHDQLQDMHRCMCNVSCWETLGVLKEDIGCIEREHRCVMSKEDVGVLCQRRTCQFCVSHVLFHFCYSSLVWTKLCRQIDIEAGQSCTGRYVIEAWQSCASRYEVNGKICTGRYDIEDMLFCFCYLSLVVPAQTQNHGKGSQSTNKVGCVGKRNQEQQAVM